MNNDEWRAAHRDIVRLLRSNQSLITEEYVGHVNHYLGVGEHEMALEILCLELMHKPEISLSDLEELGELAKRFGLDQETVYDSDFWQHFTAALEARRKREATPKTPQSS